MKVRYIDPNPVITDAEKVFVGWDALASADVVSLHVPLTKEGEHATHHLLNEANIGELKCGALLINASRGLVIQQQALLARLQSGPTLHCALDVWEHEPQVSAEVVERVGIATPHIAGHTQEGKIRGSYFLYKALAAYYGWSNANKSEQLYMPKRGIQTFSCLENHDQDVISQQTVTEWVRKSYAIMTDDQAFRSSGLTPVGFDSLRKKYQQRRELSVTCVKVAAHNVKQCLQLGFQVVSTPEQQ